MAFPSSLTALTSKRPVNLLKPHDLATAVNELAAAINRIEEAIGAGIIGDGVLEQAIARANSIFVQIGDETTAITTGTAKTTFRIRAAASNQITDVRFSLATAQVGGTVLTIDVKKNGTSILDTLIAFANGSKTTAAVLLELDAAESIFTDDDEFTVDVTQIGDGTAAGLKMQLSWE